MKATTQNIKTVTLTLTEEEAAALVTICGNIAGGGRMREVTDDVFRAIDNECCGGNEYDTNREKFLKLMDAPMQIKRGQ